MTEERAPIDGLETTAADIEMLSNWLKYAKNVSFERAQAGLRLILDHDRLTTLLAEARAEIAELTEEQRDYGNEVSRLTSELNRSHVESRAREARAREEEREACGTLGIMVPDDWVNMSPHFISGWHSMGHAYRAAIRARGEA